VWYKHPTTCHRARHHLCPPTPRPLRGPTPPSLYTRPYFLGFCNWVWDCGIVGMRRFGALSSRRSTAGATLSLREHPMGATSRLVVSLLVGLPPSLRSVAIGLHIWLCAVDISLYLRAELHYLPLAALRRTKCRTLSMSTRCFVLQLHPMSDSGNRVLLIVHPDAWVLEPFQVTIPSLPAEWAYCGPVLQRRLPTALLR
jgi:hypothetical protein